MPLVAYQHGGVVGPFGPGGEVFNSDTAIDIQYFYLDKTYKYLY